MMIQSKKESSKRESILKLILSWMFVCAVSYYLMEGEVSLITRSILNVFEMLIAWKVFSERSRNRRIIVISAICGCFFSAILLVGQSIFLTNGFGRLVAGPAKALKTLISLIGFASFFSALFSIGLDYFERYEGLQLRSGQKSGKTGFKFLVLWVLTLLSWVPCYLAYYPGIMMYDAPEQLRMAYNGLSSYTTHHPPLHTMILELCVKIGTKTGMEVIQVYSVIQMVLMSAALAYLMMYILRKMCNTKTMLAVLIIYYMLNPIIAIFSFEMTKDSYFMMAYVLFSVGLYSYIEAPEEYRKHPLKCVSFAMTILFSMLFRHNAFYVMIVLMIMLLIFWGKKYGRLLLTVIFAAAICVYSVITGPVYQSLGIQKNGIHEMTAVPMQQISLVYLEEKDNLDAETVEEIGKFIDPDQIEELYNPRFYDPIKDFAVNQTALNENKGEFFSLWLKLGVKYPKEYVRAFLMLNVPYWYPEAKSWDEFSRRPYIEDGVHASEYYSFQREPKLPLLLMFYQEIASYLLLEKIPVINFLTSITASIWILLAAMVILFARRMYREMMAVLPSVLLWGTYMLGPVSNFRYVFPIFVLYLFYMLIAVGRKNKSYGSSANELFSKDADASAGETAKNV